jgi:hypothetical protein
MPEKDEASANDNDSTSDCPLAWSHTVTPRLQCTSGKATLTMTVVLSIDWLTPLLVTFRASDEQQ